MCLLGVFQGVHCWLDVCITRTLRGSDEPLELTPLLPCAAASCRSAVIPSSVFEVPSGYTVLGSKQRDTLREEEEDLLQFAIQQSLLEAGSEHDQVGGAFSVFIPNHHTLLRHGQPNQTNQ